MTGRIYHPETKHPQPYRADLSPDASKGINRAEVANPQPTRTAADVRDLRESLRQFTGEELRQVIVMNEGDRLEAKAAYAKLSEDGLRQIQAAGDEQVHPGEVYVSKQGTPYTLWNRLVGKEH